MLEARKTVDEAYIAYQHARSVAMDTDAGADEMLALRREGEVYAHALNCYSEASMAWLAYVDRNVRPPFKSKGAGA
jgi:hypothetical protein